MGIYGHKFDNLRTDLHSEIVQESIVDAFKSIIESIKKGIVNLIDKINGWLDKHPDSKVAQKIKNILTKLKNLLTKADKIKSKEDAEEVKGEYNKCKDEFDSLSNEAKEMLEYIDKCIETKDKSTLIDNLGTMCYEFGRTYTFSDFDKILKYASSKMNLFENYTDFNGIHPLILCNKKLEEVKKEDYYKAIELMEENFCKERIAEVKKLASYLYGAN